MMRPLGIALFAISALTWPLDGQRSQTVRRPGPASRDVMSFGVAGRGGGSSTQAIIGEALAGTAGSLLGMATVGLTQDCGNEDLGCLIKAVGAGGALGVVGATVGTTLAAQYNGSPRSVTGAALGAVLGTGVGLGVHWLLNNNSDRNFDRPSVVVPIFAISQGVLATVGSRALGR